MRASERRRRRQSGNELIEFALAATFLLPVLFGTIVIGLNLGRSIQVSQVSRDAGHMYALNVDFADPNNRNIIERLALGLNIKNTGGSGVLILSTVMFVGQAECDAAGLAGSACVNLNRAVFIHRLVIGAQAAHASAFGTPSPTLIDGTGRVSNYLTDTSARASGFVEVLPLQAGEVAYVSEVYVPSTEYGMPGFSGTGVYCRTIF